MSTLPPHVGIVGAGVAGLCTAQLLGKRGIRTTLFDKGRGLGGRLARRQTTWANLDIGAPFFHLSRNGATLLQDLAPDLDLAPLPWQQQSWHRRSGLSAPQAVKAVFTTAPNSNRLCHSLAKGLQRSMSTRVTAIRHSGQSTALWGEDGTSLGTFDAVVVAVPADQCADLLPLGSSITLADHRMTPRWTLQLELEAATALLSASNMINFQDHPVMERLVDLSALPGRSHQHCIQLSLQADFAAANKHRDDSAICDAAIQALSEIAPLPGMRNRALQRWRLGGNRCSELTNITDASHRVVIAGDWSAGGDNVEAALRSAERACTAVERLL